MLTKRQYELLMFVHEKLKEVGISPSFDEMKLALGLKSKSGVHRLIKALEERGFVRRLKNRARALEIAKLPSSTTPIKNSYKSDFSNITQPANSDDDNDDGNSQNNSQTIHLGIMGRIAAGTPAEAIQEEVAQIEVPTSLTKSGEHYALEVSGDSMIDAGILDRDTAIIQKTHTAQNGDVVVALIENNEATLKRLRRKGDMIALEAANKSYETRLFKANQVQIQGKLVGLLRKY